jgi:hypothetical protein
VCSRIGFVDDDLRSWPYVDTMCTKLSMSVAAVSVSPAKIESLEDDFEAVHVQLIDIDSYS